MENREVIRQFLTDATYTEIEALYKGIKFNGPRPKLDNFLLTLKEIIDEQQIRN